MFLVVTACAQEEKLKYDSVAGFIQQAINAGQSEKVYAMTAEVFRAKMSAVQFATGVNKFRVKMGKWTTLAFQNKDEKGWNYVAAFALGRQLFSLKLDAQGKIERMNFAAVPVALLAKDTRVPDNNPMEDAVDRLVERLVRPYIQKGNTVGLVLAVIDHGRVRRYSYGTTGKGLKELPDAGKTIFEIGSVTKTFTSLLLARQIAAGRMRLEDPIQQYLPDSIPSLAFRAMPIRLVHLANHTSGFPRLPENIFKGTVDPKNPYVHYGPDSLYSFLVHYKPEVAPGTVFSYSNYAAGLLGTILEKQYGMDFGRMVTTQICGPLGMSTTFVDVPARLRSGMAQGHDENGQRTSPWDLASLKGSGAIRSTLNDMVRYAQAQLGGASPLKEAIGLTHAATFKGPGQVMGLGWRINKSGQYTYYHHSGGTGGFRSFVGFDTGRQLGVVILSNAAEEVTAIGESLIISL